jgi:hypothetical protein
MAVMRDPPSKLRFWDLLRTPGKRRQRIVCASFGLLFTLVLILACAGVFSKNRVAPVVNPSTGNVGADGTDNGGINVSGEARVFSPIFFPLVTFDSRSCKYFRLVLTRRIRLLLLLRRS